MNKSKRQGTYFVFIFVVMFVGYLLLKMTMFQCLIILILSALVMKLTDIEDTLSDLR